MANELKFFGVASQTGLTVTARLYDNNGEQFGDAVALTEVNGEGIYRGDMPEAPAGYYGVRFYSGGQTISYGALGWDGEAEITMDRLMSTLTAVQQSVNTGGGGGSSAGIQATLDDLKRDIRRLRRRS